MILLIDNYDSFTWNLVHYLGDLGQACDVRRNDALSVAQAIASKPAAIVLSPGPGTPGQSGICLDLVRAAADTGVPLFGVCLGLQAIGEAFGGAVVRAPVPMHGKVSPVTHFGGALFEGVGNPFAAARYHSLAVGQDTLPAVLEPLAETADGVMMAARHRTARVWGVQFHPESIASEGGHQILRNFLRLGGVVA